MNVLDVESFATDHRDDVAAFAWIVILLVGLVSVVLTGRRWGAANGRQRVGMVCASVAAVLVVGGALWLFQVWLEAQDIEPLTS